MYSRLFHNFYNLIAELKRSLLSERRLFPFFNKKKNVGDRSDSQLRLASPLLRPNMSCRHTLFRTLFEPVLTTALGYTRVECVK